MSQFKRERRPGVLNGRGVYRREGVNLLPGAEGPVVAEEDRVADRSRVRTSCCKDPRIP